MPYPTRHTGIGTFFLGLQMIMRYQDGSRLLEIVEDQLLSASWVLLEFIEFRRSFVVS